jgi:hypothetical protein
MKLLAKIKFYSFLLIVLGLAGTAGYFYLRYAAAREGATRHVVDAPAVLHQIQKLNELVTVRYTIQKVIGLEEEKVPFGSEKILLLVQATALGGVDLSTMTTQDVTCASNNVTLRLPAARVLHVFPNEQETKVWDRSKTWWAPWVPFSKELEAKARRAALETIQGAAIEMGILSNAQQNAEISIREFLKLTGVESVGFLPPR